MKKLFFNAPSIFLFIGLMILCWLHVEFAPTKYSYQASVSSDELNPIAETQFNSTESQIIHFTGNHGTPLSESEDSDELDETEGKHLLLEYPVHLISDCRFQAMFEAQNFAYPKILHSSPLYVLFHSWKNHLSA